MTVKETRRMRPQFTLKTGLKAGDAYQDCVEKADVLLRAGNWYGAQQELEKCAQVKEYKAVG